MTFVLVAVGAILLILALIGSAKFWKLSGLRGSRLIYVLITDQALYFLL